MSSRRLPGKVLLEVAGRPMLGWTLARLGEAERLENVIVATSDQASDDPIVDFCDTNGITFYRGSLQDVAGRLVMAARKEDADAFVRISGDSPLIDPAIVDRAVALYTNQTCDLVSNVLVRTFPKGQSVEVLRTSTLARACDEMRDEKDREHVTRLYYSQPQRFRLIAFTSGFPAGDLQLSVDTEEDLRRVERLITAGAGAPGGWRDLVQASRTENPEEPGSEQPDRSTAS